MLLKLPYSTKGSRNMTPIYYHLINPLTHNLTACFDSLYNISQNSTLNVTIREQKTLFLLNLT